MNRREREKKKTVCEERGARFFFLRREANDGELIICYAMCVCRTHTLEIYTTCIVYIRCAIAENLFVAPPGVFVYFDILGVGRYGEGSSRVRR